MCEKPIAPAFWAYDNVAAIGTGLCSAPMRRSAAVRALYQEGSVAAMRHPDDLISRASPEDSKWSRRHADVLRHSRVHGGGLRPGITSSSSLKTRCRRRKIRHGYSVAKLANFG